MSIDNEIRRAFERHEGDVRPRPGAWAEVQRRIRRRHRARIAATAVGVAAAIAGAIVIIPGLNSTVPEFEGIPEGWTAQRSPQGGYRVAHPPDWKVAEDVGVTSLVPPDSLRGKEKAAFSVTLTLIPEPYDRSPSNYRYAPDEVRISGRRANRYSYASFEEPDQGIIYRIEWPRICPPGVLCEGDYTLVATIAGTDRGLWDRHLETAERIVKTAEPSAVSSTQAARGVQAKIGADAIALAATPDALWALRPSTGGVAPGSLVKITPETNRVVDEITVGVTPAGLAAAPDAVWVTHNRCEGRFCTEPSPLPDPSFANSVWRIDPRTNRVVAKIPVADADDIAIGEGAVWVSAGTTVYKIDPRTNKVVIDIRVGGNGSARLATGGGFVWAVSSAGGGGGNVVSIVDPQSHRVLETIDTQRGADQPEITFGFGTAWVTTVGRDSPTGLLRIDPTTMKATRTVTIPEAGNTGLDLVTTGAGSVWTVSGRGEMSRVDPARNVAVGDPFVVGDAAPQGATDIVVAFGSVWVASSDGQIWRLAP